MQLGRKEKANHSVKACLTLSATEKTTKDVLLLQLDHPSLWKLSLVHYLFRKKTLSIFTIRVVNMRHSFSRLHSGWQSKTQTEFRQPAEQESLKKGTLNKCTINVSSAHSGRAFSHCCMSMFALKAGHGCLEKSHRPWFPSIWELLHFAS